jgi:hypothetical protein
MTVNTSRTTIVVRVGVHEPAADYSLVFRKLREGLAQQQDLAQQFVKANELCQEIEDLRRASVAAQAPAVRTFTVG